MFKNCVLTTVLFVTGISFISAQGDFGAKPGIPFIHSVGMSKLQPQENDPSVIWYDDFSKGKDYLESSGVIDYSESFNDFPNLRWATSLVPRFPLHLQINPVLYKTPYHGPGELEAWEVEVASDYTVNNVVYKSGSLGKEESITVDAKSGKFTGPLQKGKRLVAESTYFSRVRQKSTNGQWSDWTGGISLSS